MAEQKTIPTGEDVEQYLSSIEDEKKRQDCFALLDLMRQVTGESPRLWVGNIVGFGQYHYKYASGHEGDAALAGFAARKGKLSLYVLSGFDGQEQLLAMLGKHKAGKGCLYVNRLDDIDLPTLRRIVQGTVSHLRRLYPAR
jgi:Domain of unknown function (DU1801)